MLFIHIVIIVVLEDFQVLFLGVFNLKILVRGFKIGIRVGFFTSSRCSLVDGSIFDNCVIPYIILHESVWKDIWGGHRFESYSSVDRRDLVSVMCQGRNFVHWSKGQRVVLLISIHFLYLHIEMLNITFFSLDVPRWNKGIAASREVASSGHLRWFKLSRSIPLTRSRGNFWHLKLVGPHKWTRICKEVVCVSENIRRVYHCVIRHEFLFVLNYN